MNRPDQPLQILTIGHSTRTLEAFLDLLKAFHVTMLVDVRSFPGSRRFPHFNQEALSGHLSGSDITYEWLPALGGRRKSQGAAESPNTGLRHAAFRAYADHMLTSAFRGGIDRLLTLATTSRTAIMCAEAVYWTCHRRLISDYLVAHGVQVHHILGPASLRPHGVTPGAALQPDGTLLYEPAPAADGGSPSLFGPESAP